MTEDYLIKWLVQAIEENFHDDEDGAVKAIDGRTLRLQMPGGDAFTLAVSRSLEGPLYINYRLHTDTEPFEVIELNAAGTRAKVRAMKAERDPSWKPEWTPGGYAGHCTNNREQRWACEPDPAAQMRMMTKRKDGYWRFAGEPIASGPGNRGTLEAQPRKFHDYNF